MTGTSRPGCARRLRKRCVLPAALCTRHILCGAARVCSREVPSTHRALCPPRHSKLRSTAPQLPPSLHIPPGSLPQVRTADQHDSLKRVIRDMRLALEHRFKLGGIQVVGQLAACGAAAALLLWPCCWALLLLGLLPRLASCP